MSPVLRRIVPLAALFTLPVLCSAPARADAVLATSGSYRLTQQAVNADISWSEWLARHPFTPEEQRAFANIDVAQFRRNPKRILQGTHAEQTILAKVQRYTPFAQADVRQANLVRSFFMKKNGTLVTADEAQTYRRIMAKYVKPVIIVPETASNVVVAPADVEAGLQAARFFAAQLRVAAPTASQYAALIARMKADPTHEYRLPIFLNGMEAKWLATQAIWKVSGAAARRGFLAGVPVASRRDPFLLARAVPEACGLPASDYTMLYHQDGTRASQAEAMRTLMIRRQGMQMLTNTFNRGQEEIRRQSQEDYERRNYEEAVRRR